MAEVGEMIKESDFEHMRFYFENRRRYPVSEECPAASAIVFKECKKYRGYRERRFTYDI